MDNTNNAPLVGTDNALLKILLVEDDEDDYVIIRDLLSETEEKFELEWVNDYEAALKAIEREEHDVCLLDYRLGERSGLEFLREASKRSYKAPIILLTGQGDREVDLEAMQTGAADYLLKGQIDTPMLERSIRYAFVRRVKALGESERRFRSLVQNASDIIMVLEGDGTIRYISPAVERVLGYKPENAVGNNAFDIVHPNDMAGVQNFVADAVSNPGFTPSLELRLRHADGSWRYIESTCNSLLDEPAVGGVVFNSRDITERKQAEAALQESYGILRAVTEGTTDFIYVKDLHGRYVMVNSAAANFIGKPVHEVIGKDDSELFPPEIAHDFIEHDRKLITSGATQSYEERDFVVDGETRSSVAVTGVWRDARGDALGVFGISRDVTERKQAEKQLQESEANLSQAQRIANLGSWEYEPKGNRVYWSDETYRILGFTPRQFIPTFQDWMDSVHPEDRTLIQENMAKIFRGEQLQDNLVFRIVRPDGEVRFVQGQRGAERDDTGELVKIVGTIQDITETRLAEEQVRFQAHLLGQVQAAVIATDLEGTVTHWNEHAERLYGWSREEALGRNHAELTLGLTEAGEKEIMERLRAIETWEGEAELQRKDGSTFFAHVIISMVHDGEGRPVGIVGVSMDITERKWAEEELRKSEATNRAILAATPDLMFRVSREGVYLDFRANDDSKLYVPPEEIVGKNLSDTMPPELVAPVLRNIAKTLDTGEMQVFEYQLPMAGNLLDYEARLVVSGPQEILSIVRDVTEQKALERRLEHQAFHDALTGLPNRALFMDRVEHALARAGRRRESVAVLFVDLDNFKVVNDSLGHDAGDRLLISVTQRLQTCLRPEDTLARLGGDEFIILLEDLERINDATGVAERVAEALRDPFVVDGQEVFATVSIGIALGSSAQDQPKGLLRSADLALYRAKGMGKNRYKVFDPDMDERVSERLKLESEFRWALERGELRVYYQPQVLLETGKAFGVEALVRWEHPERGLLSPDEFISLAEETGLIVPLGKWMLEEACYQAKEWHDQCPMKPPLTVCVNLSARQFRHPSLVEEISDILESSGLEPETLVLEITETVMMEEGDSLVAQLRELKASGIGLSIDDFGTGYSSLSYLIRFPLDYLKIDKSFIAELGKSTQDVILVSAVINLAKTLGLKVIAEGIETEEQLVHLRKIGCELAQGHYFWKPLPSEAVSALLEMHTRP